MHRRFLRYVVITFLLSCLSTTVSGQVAGGHISRPTNKNQKTTTTPTGKKQRPNEKVKKNVEQKPVEHKSSVDAILQRLISNMVYVEGGIFTMGETSEQGNGTYDDAKPAHKVTLSSFYIGKYEVTQEEWQAVMGNNPSQFKGAKRPVECVSWDDCQTFIIKLNSMTNRRFRLPTEAEWEYAARGGRKSRGYKYSGSNNLSDVAWYGVNSGSQTHDIKTKRPNELGIYDMSGNVWEWCQDWYGGYNSNVQINPKGASSGSYRVRRGGSYRYSVAKYCCSSNRSFANQLYRDDDPGFRLALSE